MTKRITISGTALRAGFVAPKMGNICMVESASRQLMDRFRSPHTENYHKQEIDIRNVVELEPKIFGDET